MNDLYIHARNNGLKSTYYLRTKSASEIEKSTTITQESGNNNNSNPSDSDGSGSTPKACSILDPECESCQ